MYHRSKEKTHENGPLSETSNKKITKNVCVRLSARADRPYPDISVALNSPALILYTHGWKQIMRE